MARDVSRTLTAEHDVLRDPFEHFNATKVAFKTVVEAVSDRPR